MSKEQLEQRRLQEEWAKYRNPYDEAKEKKKKTNGCMIS